MSDKLTFASDAQRVLLFAKMESEMFLSPFIAPEYLLSGIAKEGILNFVEIDVNMIRQYLINVAPEASGMPEQEKNLLVFSVMCVFEYAEQEMIDRNHKLVRANHLLAGILRLEESIAKDILLYYEVDPLYLYRQVMGTVTQC